MSSPSKPLAKRRLLLISQAYVPDYAAVGQHFADLTEKLATEGWEVEVLTSRRRYSAPHQLLATHEIIGGVSVTRLSTPIYTKSSLKSLIFAQVVFVLKALIRVVLSRHYDLVVVSTSPPFAAVVGATLQALKGTPYIWWVMDLNPDQLIAAGLKHQRSIVVRAFNLLNNIALQRAARVIALDKYMKSRLLSKCNLATNITVVPPWPLNDQKNLHANKFLTTAEENDFKKNQGWSNNFVVMYSGNHGRQHPLETLLASARLLARQQQLLFAFIGDGDGKVAVDTAVASGAKNIASLPYQPLCDLSQSLSAADLHVVCMADNIVGIVHPCKIYGAMVAAKPILFFGPRESHIGQLIDTFGFGWRVDHGDVAAAVSAITTATDLPKAELTRMGNVAFEVAKQRFSRRTLIDEIRECVITACS